MLLRVYQTGFNAGLKGSANIPNTTGTYTIQTPVLLEMTDRSNDYPITDPRAWPFDLFAVCTIDVNVIVNGSNITVSASDFHDWKVQRVRSASAVNGSSVVQGNYIWYSSINGAELYHYIGPTVVTATDTSATWPANGGTTTISAVTIKPQTETPHFQVANMINNVNGLTTQAQISFFNDLPPDYRPGAIVGADGQWLSHNRNGGNRAIFDGSSWKELRTDNGGTGTGNPPSIYNGSVWNNQRNIGLGG